jgi:hypothetical protein
MPDLAYDAGADFIVTWDRLLLNADLLFGVEEVVEELTSRGVIFECYEEGRSSRTTRGSPRSKAALRWPTSGIPTATPFR